MGRVGAGSDAGVDVESGVEVDVEVGVSPARVCVSVDVAKRQKSAKFFIECHQNLVF